MSVDSGRALILTVLAIMAAAIFVMARLEVTTDISDFLPTGPDREQARISQAFARGDASRTIIVTIEARSSEQAVEISTAYEEELRSDAALMESLSFVEAGPPTDVDRALWDLYHPRRSAFVAADEARAASLVSDEGLRRTAGDLHRRLTSPLSTLITQVAPEDPFLSTVRLLERLQAGRTDRLATIDGRFVADERFAVLMIGTHASAFDAPRQRAVLEALDAAHARLSQRTEAGALETSALSRFSIRAEETIKADIQRTTILSVAGLFLLCLLFLRSFRLPVLAMVPIGCALVVATAVSLLLYGKVHGLTFAFGASLIGVCVDYVVHTYVHHTLHPRDVGPRQTLKRIWPALALGAATTAVGFAVIALSSFPGLRQVAIFACVGVVVALVGTRVLLPPLLPRKRPPAVLRDRLAQRLATIFERMRRDRRRGWIVVTVAVVATLWGVFDVQWEDDLGRMTRLDPQMVAEDERVRERVARFDQGRFVVSLGDDEEGALQVNDAVAEALAEAAEAGELGGWHGVATLLPSARRQAAVDAVLRQAPSLRERLNGALAEAGFNEDLFAPFYAYLEGPPPRPLVFDDLVDTEAAPLVRSMRIELDDRVAFVSLLRDVEDPAKLQQRLAGIEGAKYVDQPALMASAMQAYRVRTVMLLGIGILAVMGVLFVRYRSLRIVLAVMAPAVLAAGVTVATLAALHRTLDLVGLTAILMILSIGVDYGVFLAESRNDEAAALPATLLGLVVCWLTTVLGFGVLALSEHPTMNMIGLVAAVGVTASLLLAPTTLALLPEGSTSSGGAS